MLLIPRPRFLGTLLLGVIVKGAILAHIVNHDPIEQSLAAPVTLLLVGLVAVVSSPFDIRRLISTRRLDGNAEMQRFVGNPSLIHAEGPITPSDLADRMGFARASVTAIIDQLEAKQLVRRVPHPSDGRSLGRVRPGRPHVLAPVYCPFFESLADMVEEYTAAELDVIARAFDDVATRQKAAADQLDSTIKDAEADS